MCSLCCQQLQLPPLPLQRLRRLHLLLRAVVTPAIPFLRPHWHRRQFPHCKHQSRSREQCILPASTPTRIARAPPRASLSHQVCLSAGPNLGISCHRVRRLQSNVLFSQTKSELQQPVKSVRLVKYSFFVCYGNYLGYLRKVSSLARLDPLVLPSARKYWPLVTVRHVQTLVVTQTKVLSTQ